MVVVRQILVVHLRMLILAALVDQLYAELQAAGGGRLDTSSLIRRLR